MSDNENDKDESLPFDKSQDKMKKTQQAPNSSKLDDDSTLVFDDARLNRFRRKTEDDPSKDTVVLSKDDRRLKRMLQHQSEENDGTMSLGNKQEVILLIRGMVERVMMEADKLYKLGRFELGMNEPDEIDLTPYGAQDRGVSRVHAQLQIIDGIVHITDLGSTNGTFVNSTRLKPETPIALRKGDEILIGRLAIQVLFR